MNEQDATAYAQLKSELLLPITEMRGDVRLILQRMDQQDQRSDEQRAALAILDGEVDEVRRTAVTRDELAAALTQLRAETDERTRRRLTVANIVVGIVAALLGASVAVIAIIAR